MRIAKWLRMTLREIAHGPAVAAEADEEMRFHIAMETERNLRAGLAPDDAHRDAVLAFGGVLRHQESMRDEQPSRGLERVIHDVRFALRMLRKTPGFTFAAVLTLAVGIGGNTAVFSAVNGVLLHPLPYPNADRLVTIAHTTRGGDIPKNLLDASATHVVYATAKSFEAMALYQPGKVTLNGGDSPERIAEVTVTQSIFSVLSVSPELGRAFLIDEYQPHAADVVMISDALWRRRFGADRAVIGRSIRVDGHPSTIVGVLPRDVAFPSADVQLWMPMQIDVHKLEGFHTPGIGLLRPGVTPESAERELIALLPRATAGSDFLTPQLLENAGIRPDVHPYAYDVVGSSVRRSLWTLWATVLLVLLIACVNVASLLAVRAESRRREMSLRSALGAERRHLLAQSITESTVLVLLGAALGVTLASIALGMVRRFNGDVLPRMSEVRIDGAVLLVTALVAAGAAVTFGVAPLSGRGANGGSPLFGLGTRGGTSDARSLRMHHVLVVSQVAMAAMLLVVCGLMVRTAKNLARVDIGFRPDSVLTFRIALPDVGYPKPGDVARFHHTMLERIRALPGVIAAGATSDLPLSPEGVPGDPLRTDHDVPRTNSLPPAAEMRVATPGYLEAMGIPLRRGRVLRDDDDDSEHPSGKVLVTDAVVRTAMAGRDAIGTRVAHGLGGVPDQRPWSEVVGVVGDVRGTALEDAPMGAVYYPMVDAPGVNMEWLARNLSYAVHVRTDPGAVLPSVRSILRELDPTLPLYDVRTLRSIVDAASSKSRFAMMGLTIAALAGLLLGSIGLYGMLAFTTLQRTREIGVRIALGAKPAAMRVSVLRQGLELCVAGLAIGLVAAVALRVAIRPLLYEVSATDPLTFVAVAAVLLLVGTVAAWIPASRAAHLDPVRALRSE
ncbi:MAG TPA: ABC transporter permease [Gemmatimonadaceae bacterium]|nr:ABC transporter permease [Gemmatimonadaceae bacterium]